MTSSDITPPSSRAEVLAAAQQLMQEKDKIENEINEYNAVLTSHGVTFDTALVDAEGFPIPNVDLYAVRSAKNQIIRLKNDHKALMNQIEKTLHTLHSLPPEPTSSATASPESLPPFAIVNAVAPDSPAKEAGLVKDDLIIRFGSLDKQNNNDLKALPELVSKNEGKSLQILIKRTSTTGETQFVNLELRPHKWNGRGLLGCHILPYKG
ncbi:hypothetical protein BKA69DRAFT_1172754 [Paraphysoderma sedebokerense]|nr:hypothetical protein BKA69DRAFT_1172754 [Paraphysoderma sedebokerense]